MVVTQKEMHTFKLELNAVLEGLDKRLKALETKTTTKSKSKTTLPQGVDKAA